MFIPYTLSKLPNIRGTPVLNFCSWQCGWLDTLKTSCYKILKKMYNLDCDKIKDHKGLKWRKGWKPKQKAIALITLATCNWLGFDFFKQVKDFGSKKVKEAGIGLPAQRQCPWSAKFSKRNWPEKQFNPWEKKPLCVWKQLTSI
jgi:hypothetical protein